MSHSSSTSSDVAEADQPGELVYMGEALLQLTIRVLGRPFEFAAPNQVWLSTDDIAEAKVARVVFELTLWEVVEDEGARFAARENAVRLEIAELYGELLSATSVSALAKLREDRVPALLMYALHPDSERRLDDDDCLKLAESLVGYDWLKDEAPDIYFEVKRLCPNS
jgi:hypothetical protein